MRPLPARRYRFTVKVLALLVPAAVVTVALTGPHFAADGLARLLTATVGRAGAGCTSFSRAGYFTLDVRHFVFALAVPKARAPVRTLR